MNVRSKAGENLIIIVLLVVVLSLGVFLLYSRVGSVREKVDSIFKQEGSLELNLHDFGTYSIVTDLNSEEASYLSDFIKAVVKEELLPTELTIREIDTQNEDGSLEYRGSWNKNGVFLNALYVSSPKENTPQYLRIWIVTPGEQLTEEGATSLLETYFKDEFLTKTGSGEITCRKVQVSGDNEVTECGNLDTQHDGSLQGTTVRAPIFLEESGDTPNTVVSACYVPEQGTQFYNSSLCI